MVGLQNQQGPQHLLEYPVVDTTSVVQTRLVERYLHRVDASVLVHSDDVNLTLLEELRSIAGSLEYGSVRVKFLLDADEHCFQIVIGHPSGPVFRGLPVCLHQPTLLDVPQVRTSEGFADLDLHGIIADAGVADGSTTCTQRFDEPRTVRPVRLRGGPPERPV